MAEDFFRRIENPNDIRRRVLESSKEIIQNLKSYQKILKIREQKSEKIKELKLRLKEINIFLDKLKDEFPTELISKFEEEKKKKEKPSRKKKGQKGKKTSKKQAVKKKIIEPSELTKLESALSSIESKLKTLS
ncbi:hypothetical protein HQ533_01545 [Candidatus Woesearchaeota archaeon]|nr:hypothetical protein [Candidatus Woesearchaeota archaeon]